MKNFRDTPRCFKGLCLVFNSTHILYVEPSKSKNSLGALFDWT